MSLLMRLFLCGIIESSMPTDPHDIMSGARLNWLRAAVLGANDGLVSVSSVVVGVAGAANSTRFILTAGIAALVAGALSMAVGEYVSVSAQRDAEKISGAQILTNPWHAASASMLAFLSGGVIPLIVIILLPLSVRIPLTFFAVFIALIVIGVLSARAGKADTMKAAIRVVIGGILAMAVTFGIGKLFGVIGI